MDDRIYKVPKDKLILSNAKHKIDEFNRIGLHYNLVADQIYRKRFAGSRDPFDDSFLRHIVAGLIAFDMGRAGMMGDRPYDLEGNSFLLRLKSKLEDLSQWLKPVIDLGLTQMEFQEHRDRVIKIYDGLSAQGRGALHQKGSNFHAGTTKILHFLNPRLFIMIDSNAARAFRLAHDVPFRNATQPGYSAERYVNCMEHAQKDIQRYGASEFQDLDRDTPITRIYDKLTFMTGKKYAAEE